MTAPVATNDTRLVARIRIHHEQQPGSYLRPSILFLAVHEQDESDATRDERNEQPVGSRDMIVER